MIGIEVWENNLGKRIAQLRLAKGVSARDMSLSIGQGAAYIHNIENKKTMPSMRGLFYICEYFNITPRDFFDTDLTCPERLNEIISDMKSLKPEQLTNIANIIKDIKR